MTNTNKIIDAINNISLAHHDLMEALLDFSNIYFKREHNPEDLDKWLKNEFFLEQALMSTRESVVLAIQAIALDANINFHEILSGCTNNEALIYNIAKIEETDSTINIADVKLFLIELKKEIFSRIYSQNKEMQKASLTAKAVLKQRYDDFMEQAI